MKLYIYLFLLYQLLIIFCKHIWRVQFSLHIKFVLVFHGIIFVIWNIASLITTSPTQGIFEDCLLELAFLSFISFLNFLFFLNGKFDILLQLCHCCLITLKVVIFFLLNFKMYFLYALAKQPLEQDLQVRQFVDL